MGTLTRAEYEALDGQSGRSETRASAVAHNKDIRQNDEALPTGRETGHLKASEPATTMANDLQVLETDSQAATASAVGGYPLQVSFGMELEEKPIWAELYENIRDVFFPPHLPPLVLTSKPIPVPDRMAVKANPWAIGIAATVNLLILAALLFFGVRKIIDTVQQQQLHATNIDVGTWQPKAPKAGTSNGGGGGGGDHSLVDPSKGHLPKIEKNPIVPPQVQTVDKPKIAMDAAINVQKNITLPDNPQLPLIGVKSSPNVTLASNGQGSGTGIGTGSGGGIGSGIGNGYGPGYGGGAGGGLYKIGGGVSAPVPLFQPEAEFSDEARRAKYQGICLVGLIVDAQGNPQNIHVLRSLGMGLDEKAMEAVRKYKFKPAMKDGKTPVPVEVAIEVNFHLY
ncbi:MAG: energy transducer TonB [Terracidiphilus sp.]